MADTRGFRSFAGISALARGVRDHLIRPESVMMAEKIAVAARPLYGRFLTICETPVSPRSHRMDGAWRRRAALPGPAEILETFAAESSSATAEIVLGALSLATLAAVSCRRTKRRHPTGDSGTVRKQRAPVCRRSCPRRWLSAKPLQTRIAPEPAARADRRTSLSGPVALPCAAGFAREGDRYGIG